MLRALLLFAVKIAMKTIPPNPLLANFPPPPHAREEFLPPGPKNSMISRGSALFFIDGTESPPPPLPNALIPADAPPRFTLKSAARR